MNFKSIEEMPPGMRKLYEQQFAQKERDTETKRRIAELTQSAPRRAKYNAKPTDRVLPNGEVIRFDSKKEAVYYDELKIWESVGRVRDIRLQVQFLLKPAYTDGTTGERFRAISYIADFTFDRMEDDGEWKHHIVDVKSRATKTAEYAIKRKLMADMGYRIEEA